MTQDILLLTALIAVILMGSAMCSGIEAALLAVNPLRVHELARRKPKVLGARRLEKLRHRIGRTLTVVTIANNSFNIFGSLMVGSYASFIFQNRIGNVKSIFFVGLTILVLLLGEIVPKALGTRLALQISLTSAPILDFLSIIMRPLLIFLERLLPIITATFVLYILDNRLFNYRDCKNIIFKINFNIINYKQSQIIFFKNRIK